jgi:hypothetical protein
MPMPIAGQRQVTAPGPRGSLLLLGEEVAARQRPVPADGGVRGHLPGLHAPAGEAGQ